MATRKGKAPSAQQPKASSGSKPVANGNGIAVKAAANGIHATPTVEQIRVRAYQLYLERGAVDGQDQDDWYVAEKQLAESPVVSS
jgi:Protein of unknown function (DUF2934)